MDTKTFIIAGILIAVVIGVLAVFLASPDPDGMESTALVIQGDKTLTGDTPPDAEVNEDVPGRFAYDSPFPDYSMGEHLGKAGDIVAVIIGIAVAFLLVFGITKIIARPQKKLE